MALIVIAAGILTLSLLVLTSPRAPVGREARASATVVRTAVVRGASRVAVGHSAGTCRPSWRSEGYVNPLARAVVVPKRIDQGIDYAGSGTLAAIGSARITRIATVDTGWPGAFIEYRLLDGPENGCFVYYAEGVAPVPGLYVGQIVRAGQAIATIIPSSSSGIEIGWAAGAGTKSYAAQAGQWGASHEANDIPSAAGLYFSALIESLGGPPGRIQG